MLAVAGLSRRITELGYLVGGLGALIVAYGANRVIQGSQERSQGTGGPPSSGLSS
jgi:hypothetical protein